MARPKASVAVEAQPDGVEGKEIQVVADSSVIGQGLDGILRNVIMPKHKDKVIKWPYKDQVRFRHLGWKLLKIINGGDDVAEVDTIEEAEQTSKTVLAWRSLAAEKANTALDEKRRDDFNKFQRDDENAATRAKELNKMLGLDGVKAVPDTDD